MSAHLPRLKDRADLADELKVALGAAYVTRKDHVGELTVTIEREGGDKPVCIAEPVYRYYGG